MVLAENDSEALACLLEDRVSAAGMRPAFYWPVWRFGKVLEPKASNERGLTVEQAKAIGSLFDTGRPAADRYFHDRLGFLARATGDFGGELLTSWSKVATEQSPAAVRLRQRWNPSSRRILITYSFVPIIRFPDQLLRLKEGLWHLRESITVCGHPSKSKVWLTLSLVAFDEKASDTVALSRRDLNAARSALEGFRERATESLLDYYREVLNHDALALNLDEPIFFSDFGTAAETEIVSMTSAQGAETAFEALEELGLSRFRLEAGTSGWDGAEDVQDFLEWAASPGLRFSAEEETWDTGRPKILDIYAEDPACGSVRALVMPYLSSQSRRTWYGSLTESTFKADWKDPLSESACRFLAREYGRYF